MSCRDELAKLHDENKLLRAQKKRITNDAQQALTEMTEGRDYWYRRTKITERENADFRKRLRIVDMGARIEQANEDMAMGAFRTTYLRCLACEEHR